MAPDRGRPLRLAYRAEDLLRERARQAAELVTLLGCSRHTVERILTALRELRGLQTEQRGRERWHSLPRLILDTPQRCYCGKVEVPPPEPMARWDRTVCHSVKACTVHPEVADKYAQKGNAS